MTGEASELPSGEAKGIASTRYANLATERQAFLDRAKDCSKLTIPTLIPLWPYNKNRRYPTPYQSVGARVVNHLSAKLVLALFPPNAPFFRFVVDDLALQKMMAGDAPTKGQVETGLATYERSIMATFEGSALRVPLHLAVKHLIVGGNVLLYIDPKTNKGRSIPLANYVVSRDPMGNVLEIVVEEEMSEAAAPAAVRKAAMAGGALADDPVNAPGALHKFLRLYTRIVRDSSDTFSVCQEVNGVEVEESEGKYPAERCPWLALRMTAVDGESYGRGLVEEYYGDLASLEKLTKALVQFAAATAKILFLVAPTSTTKPKKLAEAESGDFVQGKEGDIKVLQIEKYADFKVTKEVADEITERLSYAFLDNAAVQRNAERVTAEEIRVMAQELDSGFGGIFAQLSQELQLPIVEILLAYKERKKELPKLPKGIVRPTVVTGLEALGRGNDLQNLNASMATISQFPGALGAIVPEEFTKRVFAANNVDTVGLVKTPEQMAMEQQQAAMAQVGATAAPEAIKAVSKHAATAAAQQAMPAQQQQPQQQGTSAQ